MENDAAVCSRLIAGRSINTQLSIRHTRNSSLVSAEMFLTVNLGSWRQAALLDREPTPWQKDQATFPRSSMRVTISWAALSVVAAPTIMAALDRLCWRSTFRKGIQIHSGQITANSNRSYSRSNWINPIAFRFTKEAQRLILCPLTERLALRLIARSDEAMWAAHRWTSR